MSERVNPFNLDLQRQAIDDHKANRMADPWKRDAYERLTKNQCVNAWIEQIGDAELYEQRWNELDAE